MDVPGDALTVVVDPLVTQVRLWLLAATRYRALSTAGVTDDDTRLFATTLDGDGTPTELAAGLTVLDRVGDSDSCRTLNRE